MDLARRSAIVAEGDIEKVASLARVLALQSDWFGLKIADIEASPDASFIQQKEVAFLQTLEFAKGGQVDLFGEHEGGEEEQQDEESGEEEEGDEEREGCEDCDGSQGEDSEDDPDEDGDDEEE